MGGTQGDAGRPHRLSEAAYIWFQGGRALRPRDVPGGDEPYTGGLLPRRRAHHISLPLGVLQRVPFPRYDHLPGHQRDHAGEDRGVGYPAEADLRDGGRTRQGHICQGLPAQDKGRMGEAHEDAGTVPLSGDQDGRQAHARPRGQSHGSGELCQIRQGRRSRPHRAEGLRLRRGFEAASHGGRDAGVRDHKGFLEEDSRHTRHGRSSREGGQPRRAPGS